VCQETIHPVAAHRAVGHQLASIFGANEGSFGVAAAIRGFLGTAAHLQRTRANRLSSRRSAR
jgi:hypothetical protein